MVYNAGYDSPTIRAKSGSVPYDIRDQLKPLLREEFIILDVGCGTCRKLIPLSGDCHAIYGVDNNPAMLSKAVGNIKSAQVTNIHPHFGHAFYLPFDNGQLDLVSCMLAPYCLAEIHRVLKPHGTLFMELLGVDDKRDLKLKFDKDNLGWRGILLNMDNATKENYLRRSLSSFFSEINIRHYKWICTISYKGLVQLFSMTPTVRDFDADDDSKILGLIQDAADEDIHFEEHRMIITATKIP